MSDKNLEAAMHIREAAQRHQKLVDSIRAELQEELAQWLEKKHCDRGDPEDTGCLKSHCLLFHELAGEIRSYHSK